MFIALLLRAMKRDVNLKRVAAFSKRLLQVIIKLHFLYVFLLIHTLNFCFFRLHFSSHHSMPVLAFSFFPNFLKPDHLYGNYFFCHCHCHYFFVGVKKDIFTIVIEHQC